MQQKIDVEYIDGRKESVRVTAWVETEIEREYDLSLEDCNRRTHVYYGAWVGLRQQGKDVPAFEEFVKTVADAAMVDLESKKPDPTRKVRKSASSSR